MSWIWLTHRISDNDTEGLQDFNLGLQHLHIEWCKARAHQNQWFEEVQLLLEEMWSVEMEGLIAYAKQQAFIQCSLSASFREKWKGVPALMATGMGDNEDEHPCLDTPP
ncbi:hypothetical protein BDR04DRAFT_1115676 [Suillus decipiens]|nr:hypothetical protein BDR04DRAFT_1115676 [Suillus decipiens]